MGRIASRWLVAAIAGAVLGALGLTAGTAATGTASAAARLLPPPAAAAPVRPARPAHYGTVACSAPAQAGCTLAGYRASGPGFRYAQAVITVPDGPGSPASPRFYLALSGGSAEARAGVRWDSGAGTWQAFAGLQRRGHPFTGETHPVPATAGGHRLFVSVYYSRSRDTVTAVLRLPDGAVCRSAFTAHHPRYRQALAVADWQGVSWGTQPAGPGHGILLARFRRGRFTTLDGRRGPFAGPWRLTRYAVVGNYVAPHTWQLSSPGRLRADRADGQTRPAGAFGIWLRRQIMP